MLILLLFSFIAGLVTILSPCIWPVLPILFSFSLAGKGRGRPWGITLGVMISFTVLTLTLSLLVRSLGINPNIFRYLAVGVIGFLGLSLLYQPLNQKMEIFFGKVSLGNRLKSKQGNNFTSGLVTGLSVGALWTPCAGPILATIITLAATGRVTATTVYLTLAYVAGVGVPLLGLTAGGQYIFSRLHLVSAATAKVQKWFGAVMIVMAVLILFNVDIQIQTAILARFPQLNNGVLNPDNNPAVAQQLNSLKGASMLLTLNQAAPDLAGGTNWLNSPPLTLADLKGKVVLVDFWTYTCINCIRTLPHLTAWYGKYKDMGLVIVGVHTPEFEFEKNTTNVTKAIGDFKITYPVVQDNNYTIWNNYQNQYWPADYLIDSNGHIRRTDFGEGDYGQIETAIQELLTEAGHPTNLPLDTQPNTAPTQMVSPESYLGADRAVYYYPDSSLTAGTNSYTLTTDNPVNSFSLGGNWEIDSDRAKAGPGAMLNYHFYASGVFLVLNPAINQNSRVNVYIDGQLKQQITVDTDKLYTLYDNGGKPEDHNLKLEFETPGMEVFAFTFG